MSGILAGDIEVVQSQVMADVPEGGGGPSAVKVPDGVSNAIYEDISSVDRALGATKMRQVHVRINTPNTERALGVTVGCTQPEDENLSVLMFATGKPFERRRDAVKRVEANVVQSTTWNGMLLENHIAGQWTVTLLQLPPMEIPPVNRVLMLLQDEGLSTEKREKFRIAKIDERIREYVDEETGKPFTGREVRLTLTSALKNDFRGTAPNMKFKRNANACVIKDTSTTNAATFVGSDKLKTAIAVGDLSFKVNSIFKNIVPSSRAETPMPNLNPAGVSQALAKGVDKYVSITTPQPFDAGNIVIVGSPIIAGSLNITTQAGTITDKGGQLIQNNQVVGTVNYGNGEFSYTAGSIGGNKTIKFKPAIALRAFYDSVCAKVTAENRALNWIFTVLTEPVKGTVSASYRSNGKWYTLYDDGEGNLVGADPSFGSGTVSPATKTIQISCGAYPDVGSGVLVFFSDKSNVEETASLAPSTYRAELVIPMAEVPDSAVTVSWTGSDTLVHSVTSDAMGTFNGNMTGGQGTIIGKLDAANKKIYLSPARIPARSTLYSLTYQPRGAGGSGSGYGLSAGILSGTLAAGLRAGSIKAVLIVRPDDYNSSFALAGYTYINPYDCRVELIDDGAGKLVIANPDFSGVGAFTVVGTVDYSTGAFSVDTNRLYDFNYEAWTKDSVVLWGITWRPSSSYTGRQTKKRNGKATDNTLCTFSWVVDSAPGAQKTVAADTSQITLRAKVPIGSAGVFEPNTLRLNVGGQLVQDTNGSVTGPYTTPYGGYSWWENPGYSRSLVMSQASSA